METKDNILAAIEAGEGLTPIHVETTNISPILTQQSQMQTAGIRFENFQRIEQPCTGDSPRPMERDNTLISED